MSRESSLRIFRPNRRPRVVGRAAEIKALHEGILGAARQSLENAIRIGELLTQQKQEVGHGEWENWLQENVLGEQFSRSTAINYMRLFKDRDKLKKLTVGNIGAALRLLYGKKATPKRKTKDRAKPEAEPHPVAMELNALQDAEFYRLVALLGEKAFHESSIEATVLQALRYSRAELIDEPKESIPEKWRRLACKKPRPVFEPDPLRPSNQW